MIVMNVISVISAICIRDHPLQILCWIDSLSGEPLSRRGEGGCVDVVWAFMVARRP